MVRTNGLGWALASLAASASWGQAAPPQVLLSQPLHATGQAIQVNLQAADAAAIAQTLGSALGATVRIDGPVSAPITLDLDGVSARAALDAVAKALYGTWSPVYTVSAGAAQAAARRPLPLGRTVTANLSSVSARAALALVARAGGGTLELSTAPLQPVTLVARDMPIEQALDELAKQAGMAWSVTYILKPGVAPAAPRPIQPQTNPAPARSRTSQPGLLPPGGRLPGAMLGAQRAFPLPFAAGTPAPGMGADAGKMLALGLAQVMQMPAAQRPRAVKDFAAQLDQQFRQMMLQPPDRRLEQMTAMRPVYQAALRTYNGLVPSQRRQFQPIIDVFNHWMR